MNNNEVPEPRSIWDEAKGHIERGEYDKAVEIYKYIIIRYADNAIAVEYANAYIGDIYLTTRQHLDLAEKHLMKAATLAPVNQHYHYLLGFTYSVKEQWAKAVNAFLKALSLDADNGEYERGLGWAMFNGGNRAKGITHMYRALELSPSNIHTMTDLATALLMLGNVEKAREYGEKALRIDPGYVLAQNLLKTIDQIERSQG
jgi:tetratricopeptide (TPR) repeat protein